MTTLRSSVDPLPAGVVVVVGSLNMDITVTLHWRPRPGETVVGDSIAYAEGGKGGNQAAAAARAGARTSMVAAVGSDEAGKALINGLAAGSVDCRNVRRVPGASGTAVITVTPDGENSIVVICGANAYVSHDDIVAVVTDALPAGTVVLTQLEVSQEAVTVAASAALQVGARWVLNASPLNGSTAWVTDLLSHADPVVVNEHEARVLLGEAHDNIEVIRAAEALVQLGARSAVVTAGPRGAAWADSSTSGLSPAPAVAYIVDSTGAGDAFAGALAASLARREPLSVAVDLAVVAGAQATQWRGARPVN